jgi:hypothetical protein
MNGISGLQEVRSSPPDHKRHQFGTGAWHLSSAHDFIARSTDISTKGGKVPDLFLKPREIWSGVL